MCQRKEEGDRGDKQEGKKVKKKESDNENCTTTWLLKLLWNNSLTLLANNNTGTGSSFSNTTFCRTSSSH